MEIHCGHEWGKHQTTRSIREYIYIYIYKMTLIYICQSYPLSDFLCVRIIEFSRYESALSCITCWVMSWNEPLQNIEKGEILWSLEYSIMRMWLSPFPGQRLVAGPGMDILVYIYADLVQKCHRFCIKLQPVVFECFFKWAKAYLFFSCDSVLSYCHLHFFLSGNWTLVAPHFPVLWFSIE